MPRLLHRHRKFLTSSVLAIVDVCAVRRYRECMQLGWRDGGAAPIRRRQYTQMSDDHGPRRGACCENVCSNDLPLFSVLQLVQDQPAGQPLGRRNITTTSAHGRFPRRSPLGADTHIHHRVCRSPSASSASRCKPPVAAERASDARPARAQISLGRRFPLGLARSQRSRRPFVSIVSLRRFT